jgi:hypothetical protein
MLKVTSLLREHENLLTQSRDLRSLPRSRRNFLPWNPQIVMTALFILLYTRLYANRCPVTSFARLYNSTPTITPDRIVLKASFLVFDHHKPLLETVGCVADVRAAFRHEPRPKVHHRGTKSVRETDISLFIHVRQETLFCRDHGHRQSHEDHRCGTCMTAVARLCRKRLSLCRFGTHQLMRHF